MNTWPEGWSEIVDKKQAAALRVELEGEVGVGHVLHGETCNARATNYLDDYLFELADGRVAWVHLTFANRPERPPWPGTQVFESLEAWRKAVEDER